MRFFFLFPFTNKQRTLPLCLIVWLLCRTLRLSSITDLTSPHRGGSNQTRCSFILQSDAHVSPEKKHTRTHIVCGLEISRGQFDKAHPPTHNKTHAHKVCTHLYALHSSSLNSSLLLSCSPLDTLLRTHTHTHIQTPHTHTNRRHTHQQKSDYPEILESAERSTEQVWLICLK